MNKRIAGIVMVIAFSHSFFLSKAIAQQPAAKTELRAVWIVTGYNIDWPDKPAINSEEQKASFTKMLDIHQRNGLNAVVVQVRSGADAFYPSPFEPWSEWLTGRQGQPPAPYYDPLEFMVTETHKRGMEFHAWMNPYRAVFNIYKSSLAATHVSHLHPEWFLNYNGIKYFDPGNKEVQQYVTAVVKDVVTRYNIDAIHFDDYFYPYPVPGKEFPDGAMFKKFGNGLSKDDWRRSNTDSIIAMTYRTIKSVKKRCQFGVSPFGVWRNLDKDAEGSDTKAGPTNYDVLYADILLWLKNGWIDYVAPQLYWEFGFKAAPYEVLVDWWSKHTYGKNCYIGIGIYKANSNRAWKDKTQLPRQIEKIRNTPNLKGMIFYSSRAFEKNLNGWGDSIRLNYFKEPALVPKMNQAY